MSNPIVAVREFRRFINTYIYPNTSHYIILDIQQTCDCDMIAYNQTPQPTIKFNSNLENIDILHNNLNKIFINFFNNNDVIKLIRKMIYTEITDIGQKELLNLALSGIQSGNFNYISLLFNTTILENNMVYLYL